MAKIDAKVGWIKNPKTGEYTAPKTLTSAVYCQNGENVESYLNRREEEIDNKVIG